MFHSVSRFAQWTLYEMPKMVAKGHVFLLLYNTNRSKKSQLISFIQCLHTAKEFPMDVYLWLYNNESDALSAGHKVTFPWIFSQICEWILDFAPHDPFYYRHRIRKVACTSNLKSICLYVIYLLYVCIFRFQNAHSQSKCIRTKTQQNNR